jgi:hypothetical protein
METPPIAESPVDSPRVQLAKREVAQPSDGSPATGEARNSEKTVNPQIAVPLPVKAPVAKELSVSELIQKIRITAETEERLDQVQDLAGRNTAEAVRGIQMLFGSERHPKVKAALLTALGDMDPALAPEARRQLLGAALKGEARDVRSTAIELLAEDDSPVAAALLEQAMKSDPDAELRDAAAEFHRARSKAN